MSLPPVVIYNKAVKASHKLVGTGITDNFQLEEDDDDAEDVHHERFGPRREG